MRIIDYLRASESKMPHQAMTVRPVGHYDDLEADGSLDYIITMMVGNRHVAYRVNVVTALRVDGWINHALQATVEHGKPVDLFTGRPAEKDHTTVANYGDDE